MSEDHRGPLWTLQISTTSVYHNTDSRGTSYVGGQRNCPACGTPMTCMIANHSKSCGHKACNTDNQHHCVNVCTCGMVLDYMGNSQPIEFKDLCTNRGIPVSVPKLMIHELIPII